MKAVDEIKDVEARIILRSVQIAGSPSIHQAVDLLLETFRSRLLFLKSVSGLKVKEVFKLVEGSTSRISKVFPGIKTFSFSYRMEFLNLMADSFMKGKRIFYYVGPSEEEGGFLGLALVPISLFSSFRSSKSGFSVIEKYIRAKIPFSGDRMLKDIGDHLEVILAQELGQERWQKIREMKAGSGLLSSGRTIKGWPFVGDTIYQIYTLLLPLYPTRAHMYKRVKGEGERARYPMNLMRDLVELLQKRFPGDFDDLDKGDVIRAIQYRMKNPRMDPGLIVNPFL